MGISGLQSWLEEHGCEHANLDELRRGAEVHIDGNGLAWYLLLAASRATPAIRLLRAACSSSREWGTSLTTPRGASQRCASISNEGEALAMKRAMQMK